MIVSDNWDSWHGAVVGRHGYSWGETQKRSKKLVYNGYWYIGHSRLELTNNAEFKRWRCCLYPRLGCRAKVTLNDDFSIVLGGGHNHLRMKDLYLTRRRPALPWKYSPFSNLQNYVKMDQNWALLDTLQCVKV